MIPLYTHGVFGGVKPLVLEVTMSGAGTFTLPCANLGVYDAIINWGDGSANSTITAYNDGDLVHTYNEVGAVYPKAYNVRIYGSLPHIYFNNGGDKAKVTDIKQWGDWQPSSMVSSFEGCSNLVGTYTDTPDLSNCTSLYETFKDCSSFTGNINDWSTSTITNMSYFLSGCTSFNKNVGALNVSSVTDFSYMFYLSTSFNNGGSSDINNWTLKSTVGAAIDMRSMFRDTPFNKSIGSWNTTEVTIMSNMFQDNIVFNQDITSWNTGKVTTMAGMFNGSDAFNQAIGSWNVSNVTNFSSMFANTALFNQSLSSWNVSSGTTFNSMFVSALAFNQNLGAWSFGNVTLNNLNSIFGSSGMSTANYTDTIVGWANTIDTNGYPYNVSMTGQTGRTFDTSRSGGSGFANAGLARTDITTATGSGGSGWTISGDTVI